MNLGHVFTGGAGAILAPAGLVLLPPLAALALALVRKSEASLSRRLAGPVLLGAAFTLAAVALRPGVIPTPTAPFSSLLGSGFHRDAAFLGVVWMALGSLATRRDVPAPWVELLVWGLGGVLLARLIPPVQGPVLAVITGPSAATTRVVTLGVYYAGMGLVLAILAALVFQAARAVNSALWPRLGALGLVVLGLCLITGVYGRLLDQMILRWPPTHLG